MIDDGGVKRPAVLSAVALAIITALAGCVPSPVASTGTPTPVASYTAPPGSAANPIQEGPPVTPTSTPEPPVSPEWTDDDLIGACKVAWNESGRAIDWSQYSPDALIQQDGDAFDVAFRRESGDGQLACRISGTPVAPSVSILE